MPWNQRHRSSQNTSTSCPRRNTSPFTRFVSFFTSCPSFESLAWSLVFCLFASGIPALPHTFSFLIRFAVMFLARAGARSVLRTARPHRTIFWRDLPVACIGSRSQRPFSSEPPRPPGMCGVSFVVLLHQAIRLGETRLGSIYLPLTKTCSNSHRAIY